MSSALVYYIIAFLGIILPRGKWLIVPVVVFVGVALANATGYSDYVEYSTAYESTPFYGDVAYRYPSGWTNLMRMFAQMGVPYQSFQVIIVIASLLLVYLFICKKTENVNLALGLLMLYPLLIECIQVRSFLAEAIGCVALLLLGRPNWKRVVAYLLVIAVAMSIHSSAVVFILPLLIDVYLNRRRKISKKTSLRGNVHAAVLTIAALFVLFAIALFAPSVLTFFVSARDATYLHGIGTEATTLLRTGIAFMAIASICSYFESQIRKTDSTKLEREYALLIRLTSTLLVVSLALVAFDYNFYRFVRFFFPAFVALLAIMYSKCRTGDERGVVLLLGMVLVAAGCSLDLLWVFDHTAMPLFEGIAL